MRGCAIRSFSFTRSCPAAVDTAAKFAFPQTEPSPRLATRFAHHCPVLSTLHATFSALRERDWLFSGMQHHPVSTALALSKPNRSLIKSTPRVLPHLCLCAPCTCCSGLVSLSPPLQHSSRGLTQQSLPMDKPDRARPTRWVAPAVSGRPSQ